ncbi:MAG TPA: DUF512 domain-containing protein [Halanaerobiales bacterium]|nr:DUF512 domain-containing protein [Halanaerobiales bacterium]
MKKNEKEYYLYKSVQDDNILPLTSKCNLSCIFCSHKQNPKDIEIISFGNLRFNKINDLLDYLNPNQPIVIGESATKIIEGEPLVHPDFKKIISKIRTKYDQTEIRITTNGDLLNSHLIQFLEKINNITLNISVNYLNPNLKEKAMGISSKQNIKKILEKLSAVNINYNFSTVALPHLFGYETVKDEIINMTNYEPQTLRVFMPGYTSLTSNDLKFDYKKVYQNLYELVHDINLNQKTPVIIEPPLIKNLNSIVKGVIKGSPAFKAGIKYLDLIKKINGENPKTKVQAFNKIKNLNNPKLEIERGNQIFELTINKEKKQKSGLVMDYDLAVNKIREIDKTIKNNLDKEILFLTSVLGFNLINYVVNEYLDYNKENINIKKVKNTYLKGSIISAGLLTNLDIENHLKNNSNIKPDLLILPKIMFDIFNNDLRAKNYKKLIDKHMFEVEII